MPCDHPRQTICGEERCGRCYAEVELLGPGWRPARPLPDLELVRDESRHRLVTRKRKESR